MTWRGKCLFHLTVIVHHWGEAGQELEGDAPAGILLSDSGSRSASFPIQHGPTCLGMVPHGFGLPTAISNQDHLTEAWPQAPLLWSVSRLGLSADSRLCRVDSWNKLGHSMPLHQAFSSGAGEKAQRWRALVFADDQGSIPRAHRVAHNYL